MNSEQSVLPRLQRAGTQETGGRGVLWVSGTDLAVGEWEKRSVSEKSQGLENFMSM